MLEILESRTAFDGRLFSVEVLRVRDAAGRDHQREVVRHPGAVTIVATTGGSGPGEQMLLIRNDRVAPGMRLLELPAGKLEPGEDPAAAAARELEEETGHRATTVRPLGRFYTSPGFADELMHVFAADDVTPAEQKLEPGEQITVEPTPVDSALRLIDDGSIIDGKTIAALCLWERARRGIGT